MRLPGLATGMDTDATIKQMLKPQQTKIDNMKKNQQVVQWQQEIYRDIIKETHALTSKYFDVLNKDNYLLGSSSLTTTKVTSSNPLLNMTASAEAKEGKYIIRVKQLATNAKMSGKVGNDKNGDAINLNTRLSDVNGIQSNDVKFKINDKEVILNPNDTIEGLNNKIKIATNSDVELKFQNGKYQLTSNSSEEIKIDSNLEKIMRDLPTEEDNTKILTKYVQMNINGKDVLVSENASIKEVASAINIGTEGKIKLEYSEISKGFTLVNSETGSSSSIILDSNAENFFENIIEVSTKKVEDGKDLEATITIPGDSTPYPIENVKSNKFSIDGINFDLNGINETGKDITGKPIYEEVNIIISKSNDEAVKKIKSFVEDYNKLVDKVNTLNTQKRNYNYKPLTDEEKKDMTDDQIAKWEAKAKQGILKGDNYLNNMLTDLRTSMFGKAGDTLFSIGISTTTSYNDGGKLEFNEEKFLKSLNEDPEKTMDTFKNGMHRLDETLKNYTSTTNVRVTDKDGNLVDAKRKGLLVEKAGYEGTTTVTDNILTKKIKEKQELIDKQIKKMATMETNYYKQFSNLETVMNKLNSQLSYLTQSLG